MLAVGLLPSQISFTPDIGSNAIIVVNRNVNPAPTMQMWKVSATSGPANMFSSQSYGLVAFSFAFNPFGELLMVDAQPYGTGPGGAMPWSYNAGTPSVTSLTDYFNMTGANAPCWIEWSAATSTFYTGNAASNNITELTLNSGTYQITQVLNSLPGHSCTDLAVATVGFNSDVLFGNCGGQVYFWKLSSTTNPTATLAFTTPYAYFSQTGLATFVTNINTIPTPCIAPSSSTGSSGGSSGGRSSSSGPPAAAAHLAASPLVAALLVLALAAGRHVLAL